MGLEYFFREVGFWKQTLSRGGAKLLPRTPSQARQDMDGGGRRHTIRIPIPDISYHKRKRTRTAGSAGISSGSRFWFFPLTSEGGHERRGRRHTIQIPIPDISCHKRGRARAAGRGHIIRFSFPIFPTKSGGERGWRGQLRAGRARRRWLKRRGGNGWREPRSESPPSRRNTGGAARRMQIGENPGRHHRERQLRILHHQQRRGSPRV